MRNSKTHCNCSNKDCFLSGDKYFHVDKWNTRLAANVPSKENILEISMESDLHVLLPDETVNTQRQDSLTDQMNTVIDLARKEGCYDAQDWIIKVWQKGQKV